MITIRRLAVGEVELFKQIRLMALQEAPYAFPYSWVAKGFVVDPIFAEQFMRGLQNWNWEVNTSGYAGIMPCTFTDEELRQICHSVLLLIGHQDRLNLPRALERARQTITHLEGEIVLFLGRHMLPNAAAFGDCRGLRDVHRTQTVRWKRQAEIWHDRLHHTMRRL